LNFVIEGSIIQVQALPLRAGILLNEKLKGCSSPLSISARNFDTWRNPGLRWSADSAAPQS
jgi:hypothetical protein